MATTLLSPEWEIPDSLFRLSVEQYQRMIDSGAVEEDDNVELLEGLLVRKMSKNPPHSSAITSLNERLQALISASWKIRIQDPISLEESRPEPDVLIAEADPLKYAKRNPGARDIGLVIEVADTSLIADRVTKKRIYARAGIAEYWIVNLVDNVIEVYSQPNPSASPPDYASKRAHKAGDSVELNLRGTKVGEIAVAEILPPA